MAKKKIPALSPSETEILSILWNLKKASVQDMCDNLPPKRQIAYATVQTLLRRLEKKGYIAHEIKGKSHLFYPVLKKESVINRTIGDFVERLFGGDPVPMLQHLAKHGKITKEDVKDLNKLINKK